jgi:hypothetical protein
LLAHGWWFSAGTPASSTNKTGCHDIAEILLKVALNTDIDSFQKIGHQLRPKLKSFVYVECFDSIQSCCLFCIGSGFF